MPQFYVIKLAPPNANDSHSHLGFGHKKNRRSGYFAGLIL